MDANEPLRLGSNSDAMSLYCPCRHVNRTNMRWSTEEAAPLSPPKGLSSASLTWSCSDAAVEEHGKDERQHRDERDGEHRRDNLGDARRAAPTLVRSRPYSTKSAATICPSRAPPLSPARS